MQYKLINKTTKEETICTKVVIDGFDYYEPIVKTKPALNDYYVVTLYDVEMNETLVFEKVKSINEVRINNESVETNRHIKNCRKILATNNPSIDIGQIIDEVEELADKWVFKTNGHKWSNNDDTAGDNYSSFIEGYNTHSQTQSLSDDEVAEFLEWGNNYIKTNPNCYTYKELLQLFKEQQIKTIYYE